jgi:hypothetical protein
LYQIRPVIGIRPYNAHAPWPALHVLGHVVANVLPPAGLAALLHDLITFCSDPVTQRRDIQGCHTTSRIMVAPTVSTALLDRFHEYVARLMGLSGVHPKRGRRWYTNGPAVLFGLSGGIWQQDHIDLQSSRRTPNSGTSYSILLPLCCPRFMLCNRGTASRPIYGAGVLPPNRATVWKSCHTMHG